ncbi:MAG: thiamine pyrophosphate-binding protein [Angelakisella sp.]|nr:thiamine pyrophosphate-binding protein [Angelakisella sp.]
MKAADWIVDYLISKGVADAFGLPGAVVLEFLYAMDRRKAELTPHLNYHEQGASFAACGYAQATGKLGIAYATRGPGMTNMLTAMADAYYDSVPVMFFTAHSSEEIERKMRVKNNQEINTVAIAASVTKYAARIDELNTLEKEIKTAYIAATSGRKGPVFLDISSSVLRQDFSPSSFLMLDESSKKDTGKVADAIAAKIKTAKRPLFLIGNGVRQSGTAALVQQLAEDAGLPVLSSRTTHDIMPNSPMYFGFIGSHGTRYSNFILSKADLILALGNRMAFPEKSKSFRPVVEKAFTIRVDIDKNEFSRNVPNSIGYEADLGELLPELLKRNLSYSNRPQWLKICNELKNPLEQWDKTPIVNLLMQIIRATDTKNTLVCDVGNHSFMVTNACVYSGASNRTLYSGSFGTLGSALPKAIGAYYGTKRPVLCFVGDQGFQMNMQELQHIAQNRLPITVVVINNFSSAMIREREEKQFGPHFVHTTLESGYGVPDLQAMANAYRMRYCCVEDPGSFQNLQFPQVEGPCLIELRTDETECLCPSLPQGNACQDLIPAIPGELYHRLEELK